MGATGAVDSLFPILLTMHELHNGPVKPETAKLHRKDGGLSFARRLTIDARSLFDADSASPINLEAARNLMVHLYWFRQLLNVGIFREMRWRDTRDMLADALTKGKVDRTQLREAMNGSFHPLHDHLDFKAYDDDG
jgi:hypothetical protein